MFILTSYIVAVNEMLEKDARPSAVMALTYLFLSILASTLEVLIL